MQIEPGEHSALRLLQLAVEAPGRTPREVMQQAGFPRRQFHAAMQVLTVTHQIFVFRHGRTRHVFPVAAGVEDCAAQVVALNHAGRSRIYLQLLARGPTERAQLLAVAENEWGCSPWTTEDRLKFLERVGLIERTRASDQRRTRLKALAPLPMASRLLGERWHCLLESRKSDQAAVDQNLRRLLSHLTGPKAQVPALPQEIPDEIL